MDLSQEICKIEDISSGRVPAEEVYQEMERLKTDISLLRTEMAQFLTALATVHENTSQHAYYAQLATRTAGVRAAIKDYCARYHRLLDVISYSQIKLNQEPEVWSAQSPKKKRGSVGKSA